MGMNFTMIESLIYGLVSGLTEFLPVSAPAHRTILMKLFGERTDGSLLRLFIHLGTFLGLYFACRGQTARLKRERDLAKMSKRRRKREPDFKSVLDLQIVKSAFMVSLLGFVLYYYTYSWETSLSRVALFLIINGIFLFIPQFLPYGNKDSRSMSRFDSFLIGLAGALGTLPGISRVGFTSTTAVIRGADRQQALTWSLLLSIPILIIFMIIDLIGLVTVGSGAFTFMLFIQYLLSGVTAFVGAYVSIHFMRSFVINSGFTGFAFYSWGAALFSMILYLTI